MTFVADDNTSGIIAETVFTDAGVTYNPVANLLTTGEISVTTLDIGGTDVTALLTADELNILDGATLYYWVEPAGWCVATTTQLNYLQGVTSGVQTQLDAKTLDGDNVNNLIGNTSLDLPFQAWWCG